MNVSSSFSSDTLQILKPKWLGTNMNNVFHCTPAREEGIKKTLSKSLCEICQLDPMPAHLLKEHIEALAPIITKIINSCVKFAFYIHDTKTICIFKVENSS